MLTNSIAYAITPSADKKAIPSKIVEYKQIGGISLNLHIFNPKVHQETDSRAAIVFFHGGGWSSGTPRQFYRQSKYLADRGMVAISAEYRLAQKHHSTPKESVKDGKSAMRWIRAHAKELGINPNMIAAGGGSAGGQIWLWTSAGCRLLATVFSVTQYYQGYTSHDRFFWRQRYRGKN